MRFVSEHTFAIETRGLTKTYGPADGVRNLNLRVPAGLFGFLGPNGSGKSTTVKPLSGLLPPAAGEVRVAGQTRFSGNRCPATVDRYPPGRRCAVPFAHDCALAMALLHSPWVLFLDEPLEGI